jgi:predicted amidohydrolase YtcJ
MLVIHNAYLETTNRSQSHRQAIAIDRGRILAVGEQDEILAAFPMAKRFDAAAHAILPGLADAHIHLEDFAFGLQKIDCETSTRSECLHRVADRAAQTPPGEWVLGHGWNQNNWEGGYGTASMLDQISPNHPIYLTHKSLHSSWANTLALHKAGITVSTPDPPGGRIGRLPDGEADGILYESATSLLEQAIPEPTLEQSLNGLRTALPLLMQMGITCVHDFSHPRCFSALQVMHANHELKLRVVKGIAVENLSAAVELGMRTGIGDDSLRMGSVKLFADGALGPQTAAMLEPYEDEPANLGMLMLDVERIYEFGHLAVANGISMAIHAIGDRANRVVLDAYAKLRAFETSLPALSTGKLRHRIEHVQVIHPDDLPRFSQLDVIASMQPIHATSDMDMADHYWGTRSNYAYAWRSLIEHHAHLAFGSDAPVESPNPFFGIHAAVTRRRVDGSPSPQGWHPEQRLSLQEAIGGFTTGAAYAAGMEDRLGKLAPGFLADLLIVNDNPFTCPPEGLSNIKPLAVMVGGEWVYSG